MARARAAVHTAGMELPYVDTHEIAIDAPREVVWAALERHAEESLVVTGPFAWVLGTEPRRGFAVAERVPTQRLVLAGHHRFSRYRLSFELADAPSGGTMLRAITHAVFPGVHGAIYRALVIGTRLHMLATRGILHAVRRRAGQRTSTNVRLGDG